MIWAMEVFEGKKKTVRANKWRRNIPYADSKLPMVWERQFFVVALVGYSSVEHRMISIGRVKLIYTWAKHAISAPNRKKSYKQKHTYAYNAFWINSQKVLHTHDIHLQLKWKQQHKPAIIHYSHIHAAKTAVARLLHIDSQNTHSVCECVSVGAPLFCTFYIFSLG